MQAVRLLAVMLLTLLLLPLAGCGDRPGLGQGDDLPSWAEMAPGVAIGPEVDPQVKATAKYMVRLVRLDLPMVGDLTASRQHLLAVATPMAAGVDLWQENGLFAGTLEGPEFDAFIAALPDAPAVHRDRIVMVAGTVPLQVAPPLRNTTIVFDLLSRDVVETQRLSRGRLQFHLTVGAAGADASGSGLPITLTPHHFFPEPSLEPRLPHKKSLDGRSYDDLTLRLALTPGQVLVVGIDPPPPPPPPQTSDPSADDASAVPQDANAANDDPADPTSVGDEAAPGVAEEPEEPPPPPMRLGEMILGMKRFNRTIQTVLLISVEPIMPTSPSPAATPPTSPSPAPDSPSPDARDTGVR